MLHIKKNYLLPAVSLCFFGLFSCKNGSEKSSQSPSDTLAIHKIETDSIDTDSIHAVFSNVLDSIYQPVSKNVLTALVAGNERYISKNAFVHALEESVPDSLLRKKPFLIITDIDLPRPPEVIFDLNRSMLMHLSAPACLIAPRDVAVVEYAVRYWGTKVIIFMAHSDSRIVGAACDNVRTGSFGNIVNQLHQAMSTAQEFADRSSANKAYVNSIAKNQAVLSAEQLLKQSPGIKSLVESGDIQLKSAFFDDASGFVNTLQIGTITSSLTKN